jgi:hypothetical protein
VNFQGTASDSDGTVASHTWAFGDGNTASVEDPGPYTYSSAGTFNVTYRVTDNQGLNSQTVSRTVTVAASPPPPPPTVGSPIFVEDWQGAGVLSRPQRKSNASFAVTPGGLRLNVGAGAFDAVLDGPTFSAGREIWTEETWQFSPGWRILSDHKLSFFMEVVGGQVQNRGGFHPGAGGDQFQFRWGADRIMLVNYPLATLWNGQKHVVRTHRRMGNGDGIIRVQIDGQTYLDITNLNTLSSPSARFGGISMPGGPGDTPDGGWVEYGTVKVYDSDPGWGI